MAEKTLQAYVVLIGSGMPDEDCGELRITIRDGWAIFVHRERTVTYTVAEITPADWEKLKVTPVVKVHRSLGS